MNHNSPSGKQKRRILLLVKKKAKTTAKQIRSLPPQITSKVGSEIIRGELQPSAWAIALAESDGSHDRAITHYAKIRLDALSEHSDHCIRKEQALEARRRAGFRKAPTPPKRPISTNLPKPKSPNRRRFRISPLWLFGFWLGASGTLAAASRYYAESADKPNLRIDIGSSLIIAAIATLLPVFLHFAIPRTRLLIRHLLPYGAWATAAASFTFGVMILSKRSEQRIVWDEKILQVEAEDKAKEAEVPAKSIAATP
jgi:hypothetical protein